MRFDRVAAGTCTHRIRETRERERERERGRERERDIYNSVLPRLLLQGAAPCPLFVTPCPFEKAEMTPCPFDNFFFFFKYQSHMTLGSVLPFLLHTHSVDCAVHLLLSHSRALLVSSALFHPFTALIMPCFFGSPR